jgi:uncharacterized protein YfdQ (DUF2303 family)
VYGKDDKVMQSRVAIAAVRTISLQRLREIESTVGDFEESASALEKVEATNKDTLPHYIVFKCAPFKGLGEREFKIRIGVITSGQTPKFVLRLVGAEDIDDQIVDEFKTLVETKMKSLPNEVFIGRFSK